MRRSMRACVACAAALLWHLAEAAMDEGKDAAIEQGRRVYNFRCYFCHGYSGDARTTAAEYLSPKPRDFTALDPSVVSRKAMLRSVEDGRPGTAMQSYRGILSELEIEAVVDFVRYEFMIARASNSRYHSTENGWPNHERYEAAYPFVRGDVSLRRPPEQLTPTQRRGRAIYLSACLTCHDQPAHDRHEPVWESRPLSFPLNGDTPRNSVADTINQYSIHDRRPRLSRLTFEEKRGASIFQANCSFCHAADGTGKNWIGSFMEPPARNLTGSDLDGVTRERLEFVIREGLPGTSMPAWKHVLRPSEVRAVALYVIRAFRENGKR